MHVTPSATPEIESCGRSLGCSPTSHRHVPHNTSNLLTRHIHFPRDPILCRSVVDHIGIFVL